MTTFNERERAFEAKFAHDEHVRFRLHARRDKLFIHWAAERLRVPETAMADFAASAPQAHAESAHDTNLLQHVAKAFAAQGITVTLTELASRLSECAAEAERQVLAEPPKFAGEL